MTRTKSTYLALIAMLLSPIAANAVPIFDVGGATIDSVDPVVGDSFSTGFLYSGFSPFASMEAFIVSETGQGPFETPGINVSGTDGSIINPLYALVAGSFATAGDFTLFLAGVPLGTLIIDLLSYDSSGNLLNFSGDTLGLTGRFFFIDGIFDDFFPDLLQPDYDRTSVPEPGTLALLGIGLFGMGLSRRRRKV